jgi:hypothetical protein
MNETSIEAFLEVMGDLRAKVQFLVDNWPGGLPDKGFTFPDGDFWPITEKDANE